MVDRETFELRLGKLEEVLLDLRRLAKVERRRFLEDRGLQAQAERWLQLAAECVVDLAFQLIADRGWPTPDTKREAFETLERQGVISAELAEALAGWAGLRNVLVHLYLRIDHEQLYRTLTGELDQLEDFARALNEVLDGEA